MYKSHPPSLPPQPPSLPSLLPFLPTPPSLPPSPPSLHSLPPLPSLPTSLPPSIPPSLPLVTQQIHCPFPPKQSPSLHTTCRKGSEQKTELNVGSFPIISLCPIHNY